MIKVCVLYNFLDLVLNCKVKLWFRVRPVTLSHVLLKYILRHFNVTTPRLDDKIVQSKCSLNYARNLLGPDPYNSKKHWKALFPRPKTLLADHPCL